MTRTPGLLDWLREPDPDRGIEFFSPERGWVLHTYESLAAQVHAVVPGLRSAIVEPGELVGLVADSGPEFVVSFFGAWVAGCTPVPLAPPAPFERNVSRRLEQQLDAAGVRLVFTQPEHAEHVAGVAAAVLAVVPDRAGAPAGHVPIEAPRRALVQFTSGSSGSARPVAVGAEALSANITGIADWLRLRPDDLTATWLPFHHDMGLVGCLLAPVVKGSRIRVLSPREFVRTPQLWLDCFGSAGATLSAAPNFGLAHVLRRLTRDQLVDQQWRFDRWRSLIVGSERVDSAVLREFVELLAPYGFADSALCPAYGLVESTLAVTGTPLRRPPRLRSVDRRRLSPGQQVAAPDDPLDGLELVGCGRPLVSGTRVWIGDDGGAELPSGRVGEIMVDGPSVAEGYLDPATDRGVRTFAGTALATGDAGFVEDGELFVLGRLGDSVKQRGVTIFAEDVEAMVRSVPDLQWERPAVLLGAVGGANHAVVVVERAVGPWVPAVADLLRRRLGELACTVVAAPKGAVQLTTSGKPRRRALWRAFQSGTLPGTVVLRPCTRAVPDDSGGGW